LYGVGGEKLLDNQVRECNSAWGSKQQARWLISPADFSEFYVLMLARVQIFF
jgi:hypothetical protein